MQYLFIAAELSENINKLYLKDSEAEPADYRFQLKCTNCGEDAQKVVTFNAHEKQELAGGKGEASFVMKCKFCESSNSIVASVFEEGLFCQQSENVDSTKRKKANLNGNKIDINDWAALLQLDCRGWEITGYEFDQSPFAVELSSGSTMDVQFDEDGTWYDYDDEAGEEVSITDFKFKVIKAK